MSNSECNSSYFKLRNRSVTNQPTNMLVIFRKVLEGIRKLRDNKKESIPARSLEMRNMKKPRSVRRAIRIVRMTQSESQKKRELYSLGCNKSERSIKSFTSNKTSKFVKGDGLQAIQIVCIVDSMQTLRTFLVTMALVKKGMALVAH